MAAVTLTAVYLSSALDLSKVVTLHPTKLKDTPRVNRGDQRVMANGRVRSVTGVGTLRSIELTDPLVTPANVAQLVAWAGTLLLFRDPFGRKEWVTFYETPQEQLASPNLSSVDLTLVNITYSEAV